MAIIHLTKGGFLRRVADIENSNGEFKFLGDKPAVIDFYADWCGPCRMLSPVLEEVSNEYSGRIDVYKVNVDDEEELSSYFGIRSIPTLIFIPVSGQMQRSQGAMNKTQLKEAIENTLLRL